MNRTLILLGASLIALSAISARADVVVVHRNVISNLNENNIRAFLEDVEQIANGMRPGMSPDEMTAYFQDHLADGGAFSTTMHFELPGKPAQDKILSLDKQQYIEDVVSGQGTMKDYNSSIDIQDIKIAPDGKSALLKTVTKEQGKLATQDQNGRAEPLIPVAGVSTCDETIVLSATGNIQMQNAVCQTHMKIDPWNGQPLTAQ